MANQRESQFPVTSIGRTAGARFQQAAVHDAHPLLSNGSVSPTSQDRVNGTPKYVPYTPRQRVAAAAMTTGTIVHPPSPQQHQGNATSKLQLMHLKAAAQNIGLDTSTIGWAILEKLVAGSEGEEWSEIWNILTSGKASLLLPLEQNSHNEKLTADFVRDHVIFCDGTSRKGTQIVTLSGLRGVVDEEALTFRSTIHPLSKSFQDLQSPISRASAFTLLPPLPTPIPDVPPERYPKFIIPSELTALPLPPRMHGLPKPPLPPRPVGRSTSATSTNSSMTSRIPNPFASLFGGNSTSKVPLSTPAVTTAPISPPASVHSIDSTDSSVLVDVSVFTIDRKITRKEVAKEMNKTLRNELHASLVATTSIGDIPVPGWVVERVNEAASDWFPFVKIKKKAQHGKDPGTGSEYEVNTIEESPDNAADMLQDFYMCLEQDMRAGGTPFVHRKGGDQEKDRDSDMDSEKERERREQEQLEVEVRIRDVMEGVERTITSLFYDRLFMQSTTDDSSHDETLTSRIAALNMLDLGFEHLDVIVGNNGPELEVVVKACGQMLSQLDPCRCPGDKAAILVAAHKVLVDGLSRLPPIRLKSEDDDSHQNEEGEPLTAKPLIISDDAPNLASELRTSPQPFPQEPSISLDQQSNIDPVVHIPIPPPISTSSPLPLVVNFSFSPDLEPLEQFSETTHSDILPRKGKPPPLSLISSSRNSPSSTDGPTLDVVPPLQEPTPVSGDILLPMLIYSVVKANPPHLVSNLLFTQRFRNQSVGGEESYCLINLMAVAEFLENVDLEALGLGDSDKVMSAADLTPIPLTRSPVTSETPLSAADGTQSGLRGRVEQQVDAIADSANKVISGVVDSSFGILRSFLPQNVNAQTHHTPMPASSPAGTPAPSEGSWKSGKPGFGLLRRESGFSIASIAASLPIAGRGRSGTTGEESGQQLTTVSRPGSLRSRASLKIKVEGDESQVEEDESGDGTTEDDEGDEDEEEDDEEALSVGGDSRSIRSFERMLSDGKGKRRTKRGGSTADTQSGRRSLSDRLARVSELAGFKGSPPLQRNSLLLQPPYPGGQKSLDSPSSSRPTSPVQPLHLGPPIQRFVECSPADLRLSEIGELLRDYRRLVEGIRAVGGFDE